MRIPVPTNRLVALTLAGAVLTLVVAGGLAVTGLDPGHEDAGSTNAAPGTTPPASPQAAGDAPTPNRNFTPAVRSGGEREHEQREDRDGDDERDEEDERDGGGVTHRS